MTEAEWMACTNPRSLFDFLEGKASDRKSRLFACGVCHRLAPFVETDQYLRELEAGERFADTGKTKAALKRGRQALTKHRLQCLNTTGEGQTNEWIALWLADLALSENAYRTFAVALSEDSFSRLGHNHLVKAAEIIRDVFGNPYHRITVDPCWLTSTVVNLANAVYSEKAFDRMPILADALMDAGCDNEEIISHCRGAGEHVRGCWVVDLLTGRT